MTGYHRRMLAAAFLWLVVASSSQPQDNTHSKSADASAQKHQTNANDPAPEVKNLHDSTKREPSTSDTTGKKKDNQPDWDAVAVSAVVQAACAVVVVGFTCALVIYSRRGWKVAKIAADAAKDSAEVASKALRITERARLAVFFPNRDEFGIVSFQLMNVGHVPAKIKSASVHVITGKRWPDVPDYSLPDRGGLSIGTVWQGQPLTWEFALTPDDVHPEFMRSETERTRIFGRIIYTDEFETEYVTGFGREHEWGMRRWILPSVPGYEYAT
jgi:hypothetical protein